MKLFLCSSLPGYNEKLGEEFLNLLVKPPHQNKLVIFSIDTTSEDIIEFQRRAKQKYLQLGIREENLKIVNLNSENIPDLEDLDILHMWGGNPYHYLQRIREIGLDEKIKRFIDGGGIYVGTSAGSAIMGKEINEHFTKETNDIGLSDLSGLGYLDFCLYSHWDTFNTRLHDSAVRYVWETGKRVIFLTDNQAILVREDKWKIIST